MSLSPRPSIRKVQNDSELRSRKSSLKSSLKVTTVSFKNTIALHKAGTFIDKSALDKFQTPTKTKKRKFRRGKTVTILPEIKEDAISDHISQLSPTRYIREAVAVHGDLTNRDNP